MRKNNLLFILSLIFILLISSIVVYKDQLKKANLNISEPTSVTSKNDTNKNIVKAPVSVDYTYISYKIKQGDRLYSIGKKFMPTYETSGVVKEIKEKNKLNSDVLQVNSTINIPAEKSVIGKN